MISDDDFLDDIDANDDDFIEPESDNSTKDLSEAEKQTQAEKKRLARKRIDDLMEKKRLKELLDDEDDW